MRTPIFLRRGGLNVSKATFYVLTLEARCYQGLYDHVAEVSITSGTIIAYRAICSQRFCLRFFISAHYRRPAGTYHEQSNIHEAALIINGWHWARNFLNYYEHHISKQ